MNGDIYSKCLEKWGLEAQLIMVIEECSELIKEVTKVIREKNISVNRCISLAEEICDVELMIDQLKFIYKDRFNYMELDLNKIRADKLEKLTKLVSINE